MDQPQGVRSRTNPQEHVARFYDTWKRVPQEEWLHRVVHTLDPISKNWYAAAELHRDTVSWVCTIDSFVLTFSTNMVCPTLDVSIRLTHTKVFDDQESVESRPDWQAQAAYAIEWYNLAIDEDDDLRNNDNPESEGHCDIRGPADESLEVTQPLKTRTVNIGVGDYWDEVMVIRATQLLQEYQDLCLMKFFEIKGIIEAVANFLLWVES